MEKNNFISYTDNEILKKHNLIFERYSTAENVLEIICNYNVI